MKKLMALAVLVVSLFAVPAFAAMVDLGCDVYNAQWYAEYKGSDVSRNGVSYDIYAIVINVKGNVEAQRYYNVSSDTQWVGYLRYVDCTRKRWATVRTMSFNNNGQITYDSGIAEEWTWYTAANTGTMMDQLLNKACVK